MSKKHNPTRRAIAVCVALLHLAVVPATYQLHVGCHHGHSVTKTDDARESLPCDDSGWVQLLVTELFRQECSCEHDHCADPSTAEASRTAGSADHSHPHEGHPHSSDSESCHICAAAFVLAVPPQLADLPGRVADVQPVPEQSFELPEWTPGYRLPSRGPPSDLPSI
jgi:hypothetical protein